MFQHFKMLLKTENILLVSKWNIFGEMYLLWRIFTSVHITAFLVCQGKITPFANSCSFKTRPSSNLDQGHGIEWIDKTYFISD